MKLQVGSYTTPHLSGYKTMIGKFVYAYILYSVVTYKKK